eukprot:scaffold2735_cov114-Isochrysis_galbana.AAC.9
MHQTRVVVEEAHARLVEHTVLGGALGLLLLAHLVRAEDVLRAHVLFAGDAPGLVGLVDGGLVHPKLVAVEPQKPQHEGALCGHDPQGEGEHEDEADGKANRREEGD